MEDEDKRKISVLDHGFVRLVDSMGDDKRIVDAARVSYQNGTKKVQSDRNLIRYLLRMSHSTPLEKVRFEFHIKTPIFVQRQWIRHRMSSTNECSARYSVMPSEFYIPEVARKQSTINRQGSSDEVVDSIVCDESDDWVTETTPQSLMEKRYRKDYEAYENLLEGGVSRELARCVLPTALYTEFYWTIDLWNLMNFLRLRLDSHAQYEIQVYARAILKLITDNCDLTYALEAFNDYVLEKPSISKFELQCIRSILNYTSCTRGICKQELRTRMEKFIHDNASMSRREKEETKILKYLFDDCD
jgi:thymidylate synthase (FAD)